MAQRTEAEQVVDAVGTVYKTLEPLDEETRLRVLASVTSLLGTPAPTGILQSATVIPPTRTTTSPPPPPGHGDRPLSLNELINDKKPVSPAHFFALFAYYREKVENKSRFARADLRAYFELAKEPPPSNYDREFNRTVMLGWMHEDGAESYLTTKGLEAIEAGFDGKALPRGRGTIGKRAKARTKKGTRKATKIRSKATSRKATSKKKRGR